MAVEAALAVGAHIEHLRELEGILIVHAEGSSHEDEQAAVEGALLHILALDLVLDGLEAEGLDLLLDLVDAAEQAAVVGHGAVLGVEAEQVLPVLHECGVVGFQELFGEGLHVNLK